MKADRAIVIFGATGDLSLRMLLPSLYFLELDGLLPAGWAVLGASRSALSDEAFAEKTLAAVKARADGHFDEGAWKRFRARLSRG